MVVIDKVWKTESLEVVEISIDKDWALINKIISNSTFIKNWEIDFGNFEIIKGDKNYRVQLIYLDKKGIGYWVFKDNGVDIFLKELLILEKYQKNRYGTELVSKLIENLDKKRKYFKIELEVGLKNWSAIKFWLQNGFNQIISYRGDKNCDKDSFAFVKLAYKDKNSLKIEQKIDNKEDIPIILSNWECENLKIEDAKEIYETQLQYIVDACNYTVKWEGIRGIFEKDYIKNTLKKGDLPPKGDPKCFKLQSIIRKEDNLVVGFIIFYHGYPKKDIFWLTNIRIDPKYQNLGYGKEVVTNLIKNIKSFNFYKKAGVYIPLKNWKSLRFWFNNGFDSISQYTGQNIYGKDKFAGIIVENIF